MRGIAPEIERLGARLAFVGSGTDQHAAWFVEDYGISEPVFADPDLLTYRALGARRGLRSSANLRTLWYSLRAWRSGFRQSETRGDALQQGAVALVLPDGQVPYLHRSTVAGDHPQPAALLAALRSAIGRESHTPEGPPAGRRDADSPATS